MTREEKIEILTMDRIWEWVYASNTESLEEWLALGFKGYDNFTDQELDGEIYEIRDKVDEIKQMIANKNKHE